MLRGGPRPGKPPLPRDERAVSDLVGTLLMVAVVVALGSVIAVLVTSTLDAAAPSPASVSLVPAAPGDATLRLLHRNGAPIPLSALAVTLERNGTGAVAVPRAAWTTPDATLWRPGDRLAFPLSPKVGADEQLRVRVFRADENVLVGELVARASNATLSPSATVLSGSFSPNPLVADGVSTARLSVRATHPGGALAVASVVADLGNVTVPAGTAPLLVDLRDDGAKGDLVGGDGVWSALVALPASTRAGTYVVSVNATDSLGGVASAPVPLAVTLPAMGEGTHIGTSFAVPTSENVTSFRLRDWSWDQLYPSRVDNDFILIRVLGDGGKAWSALILLDEVNGVPGAKQLRVWGPQNETVYAPRNGTILPLPGLDMDLLNPTTSLQWVYASGAAHPNALYPRSGVKGDARLIAAHFGHDQTTSNDQVALNTGIFSVDVVVR